MSEPNKTLVKRLVEEVMNRGLTWQGLRITNVQAKGRRCGFRPRPQAVLSMYTRG